MAQGIKTWRIEDIDFIGYTPDPDKPIYTSAGSMRPVSFSSSSDEISQLTLPVVEELIASGSKKVVLDLGKVYLVTDSVARTALSVERRVESSGGRFIVAGVPTICRTSKTPEIDVWNEEKQKYVKELEVTYVEMVDEAKRVLSEAHAVRYFNPKFTLHIERRTVGDKTITIYEMSGLLTWQESGDEVARALTNKREAVLDLTKVTEVHDVVLVGPISRMISEAKMRFSHSLEPTPPVQLRFVKAPDSLQKAIAEECFAPWDDMTSLVNLTYFDSVDAALKSFSS